MVKRYNNLSFAFFIPGMIMQVAGMILQGPPDNPSPVQGVAVLLLVVGTILAFIGFGYYAKAKGRSMLWGLCGFLSLVGLVILALLKDKSGDPWNT
jgi:hypothetical protein